MTLIPVDPNFTEGDNCKKPAYVCMYVFVGNLSLDIYGYDLQIN